MSRFNQRGGQIQVGTMFGAAPEGKTKEMVYCTSKQQCQKYGKDDIANELNRRGVVADTKMTKPALIEKLLKSNKVYMTQIKSGTDVTAFSGAFPSAKTNPSMHYMSHRDFGASATGKRLSKSEYENILKNPASTANVGILKDIRRKLGLLKEEYLTIDHAGLEMNNAKGDRYRVFVNPVTGNADWEKVKGMSWDDIPDAMKVRGMFRLGKDGLPLISQLNYQQHHVKVHKNRDGKIMQVRCYKKNPSGGEEASNCKKDKRGSIRLRWAPYDPYVKKLMGASSGKQFETPMGKFSFEELMTMPLDKIVQMLVILKLAEGTSGKNLSALVPGLSFGPDGQIESTKEYVPAIEAFGAPTGRYQVRKSTRLPEWFLLAENELYEELAKTTGGIKKTCYGKMPYRCPIDSAAPGVCSPTAELCYDARLAEEYATAGGDVATLRNAVQGLDANVTNGGTFFQDAVNHLIANKRPLSNKQIDTLLAQYGLTQAGKLGKR